MVRDRAKRGPYNRYAKIPLVGEEKSSDICKFFRLKRKRTAAYSVFWGRGACKCSVVDFAKDPAAPLTPHVRSIQPLGPPSPPGVWPGE
jgi:hypothetical protein